MLQAVIKLADCLEARGSSLKSWFCSSTSTGPQHLWQSAMSSFPLPALHSYASSTRLGSPSMGGSTSSIQPGMEKTRIFIENAASSFLLPKPEYRTTPHVGGDAGIGSSSNEWKTIRLQHRHLVQANFCLPNFKDFFLDCV